MAKTRYSIQMDFNKAKNQADKLERIAKELKGIADKDMPACIRNISVNWKGDNAVAYQTKAWEAVRKMHSVAKEIDVTTGVIRSIAGNTFRAEKTALETAEKREYGG